MSILGLEGFDRMHFYFLGGFVQFLEGHQTTRIQLIVIQLNVEFSHIHVLIDFRLFPIQAIARLFAF